MNLTWQQSSTNNPDSPDVTCFFAETDATEDTTIKLAIEDLLGKAISLLDNNINDDSLYFLVQWGEPQCLMSVIVTDETKTQDSSQIASCHFSGLANQSNNNREELSVKIRFWLKDFLSTSGAFVRYSLIAIYCEGEDRSKTELI